MRQFIAGLCVGGSGGAVWWLGVLRWHVKQSVFVTGRWHEMQWLLRGVPNAPTCVIGRDSLWHASHESERWHAAQFCRSMRAIKP
jgi:hypothetical protein